MSSSRSLFRRLQSGLGMVLMVGFVPGIRLAHSQSLAQQRDAAAQYIATSADREDLIMAPMRDGVRLASTILFPKGKPRKNLPTVLLHNPYLTEGMIRSFGIYAANLLKNDYAVMFQNVRGRYFSEGDYTFLGGSGKDGYDTIDWIVKQPWSNGSVGLIGCSSSAEEQHKLQGMHHPGLKAAVPMASGAGIGKVGPYNEMGNFYRGGVVQMLWFSWYYGAGYVDRPLFKPGLSRETMLRLSRFWNLQPNVTPPSGIDTLVWSLPLNQIMNRMKAAPSDLDDWVNRLPNDPRWKDVDFGHEADTYSAPALMINSWYDVSIGPNVAMFEHQTQHAANPTARDNQFMVIGPTTHCQMGAETEETIVGERNVGDARFDYASLIQRWFDHWLKGIDNGVTREPKVRAYLMGANQWKSYPSWPVPGATPTTFYLESDGQANSRMGNGRLVTALPKRAGSDAFAYDPRYPIPALGGSICCFSPSFQGGSFDQSNLEMRSDMLVYSSPPLTERLDVTGSVRVSLWLSSDAKDTDLTIKLIDVYPDGRAYNLDESIQRVRWREGWDRPVLMTPGQPVKVEIGPLVTSNGFLPGHRIRIEVASSNFPRFERNLNTGGNNYDEAAGVVARNVIHHGPKYPSQIVLPVVR